MGRADACLRGLMARADLIAYAEGLILTGIPVSPRQKRELAEGLGEMTPEEEARLAYAAEARIARDAFEQRLHANIQARVSSLARDIVPGLGQAVDIPAGPEGLVHLALAPGATACGKTSGTTVVDLEAERVTCAECRGWLYENRGILPDG